MDLLALNPGMLIWSIITFVILAFVLSRVAWKPILAAVEAREQSIADALERSETARAEAEALLNQQQEKLAAAQGEIQQMIQDSKKMADKLRNDTLNQAREEAGKLVERAKADIERERQAGINSLKQEVADLVVDATARLVGVVVDKNKHESIINESIAKFGQKN